MKTLHISVVDKIATYQKRDGDIVCGNSDYQIAFTFDSEWDSCAVKTARFIYGDGSTFTDVVFTDNVCTVPVLSNTDKVEVGVFAEDIITTTSAIIPCVRSVRCKGGAPTDPPKSVYDQIVEMLSNGIDGKNGTSVTVTSVVESSEDGGLNVVTFSDGKKVTVQNGKKGGTGPKGDPYTLTEADKAEIVVAVIEALGGEPIHGYIDENNHITLKGVRQEGEYTFSFEMEDGSTIYGGEFEYYSDSVCFITNNLTNCTTNNEQTETAKNSGYVATISANSGYELKSLVVTMGGTDITSSAVSGGNINIDIVTGDIVITAVAEEKQVLPPVTENLTLEAKTSITTDVGATRANTAGHCTTPYIDVSNIPKPCTIQLTGAGWAYTDASASGYVRFYAEDVSGTKLAGNYTHPSKMPNGVTMTCSGSTSSNGNTYIDATITVTSDNIGKLRFAGMYTVVTPDTFDSNVTKATLTYTPVA